MALFTTVSGMLVVALAGFWVLVPMRTLHGACHGYLFVAPCLSGATGLFDGLTISATPAAPPAPRPPAVNL